MAYITGARDASLYCTDCEMTFVVRSVKDIREHEKQNPAKHPRRINKKEGK